MFVPGLKKSRVSIAVLKDCGYDAVFSLGKELLRHMATGQVKQIRVCVKNMYKLDVEDCAAFSTKVKKVQCCDVAKILHRRLGHLHHGALKIMQQITIGLPKGALE